MKHASQQSLKHLAGLLDQLRAVDGLVERKPGTFYLRSSAFLHFHEDPAGLFADAKLKPPRFTRLPVNSTDDAAELVAAVAKAVTRVKSSAGTLKP